MSLLSPPGTVVEHVKTMIELSREAGPQLYRKVIELLKAHPLSGDRFAPHLDSVRLFSVSKRGVHFLRIDPKHPSSTCDSMPGFTLGGANVTTTEGDPLFDDLKTLLMNELAGHAKVTNTILFAETISVEQFNYITDECVIYLE